MLTRINEELFDYNDASWVTFYNEHGWVVVENFLHDSLRNDSLEQWNELKRDCAIEMGMSLEEYQPLVLDVNFLVQYLVLVHQVQLIKLLEHQKDI